MRYIYFMMSRMICQNDRYSIKKHIDRDYY